MPSRPTDVHPGERIPWYSPAQLHSQSGPIATWQRTSQVSVVSRPATRTVTWTSKSGVSPAMTAWAWRAAHSHQPRPGVLEVRARWEDRPHELAVRRPKRHLDSQLLAWGHVHMGEHRVRDDTPGRGRRPRCPRGGGRLHCAFGAAATAAALDQRSIPTSRSRSGATSRPRRRWVCSAMRCAWRHELRSPPAWGSGPRPGVSSAT